LWKISTGTLNGTFINSPQVATQNEKIGAGTVGQRLSSISYYFVLFQFGEGHKKFLTVLARRLTGMRPVFIHIYFLVHRVLAGFVACFVSRWLCSITRLPHGDLCSGFPTAGATDSRGIHWSPLANCLLAVAL
jgi:hypothetical protein